MKLHALAALLMLAGPLAGQQPVGDRLAGHLPPPVVAAVEEIAAEAAAQGLPIEPLVQKALEGGAKGAPPERVIAAVRAVALQLADAARALRDGGVARPEPAAIAAGAFALNAGLNGQEIAQMMRAGRGQDAAVTLRVAGTLSALGVPAAETVALVSAALSAGRPPAELLSLPGRLQAEMARGATPAQAAAGLARAAATAGRRAPPVRPASPPPVRPKRP